MMLAGAAFGSLARGRSPRMIKARVKETSTTSDAFQALAELGGGCAYTNPPTPGRESD